LLTQGLDEFLLVFGYQHFGGLQAEQLVEQFLLASFARDFGRQELACGDIDDAQPVNRVAQHSGDEVVVRARIEHRVFHDGAWGQHARDAAFDETFGEFGVFDLVADGDAVAFLHEFGEVAFVGVDGHARHRDAPVAAVLAPRQHDFQLARGDFGVFPVELIKVADLHRQQHIGVLRFQAKILLQHRRLGSELPLHRVGLYPAYGKAAISGATTRVAPYKG
jgi:hypothetical protein